MSPQVIHQGNLSRPEARLTWIEPIGAQQELLELRCHHSLDRLHQNGRLETERKLPKSIRTSDGFFRKECIMASFKEVGLIAYERELLTIEQSHGCRTACASWTSHVGQGWHKLVVGVTSPTMFSTSSGEIRKNISHKTCWNDGEFPGKKTRLFGAFQGEASGWNTKMPMRWE